MSQDEKTGKEPQTKAKDEEAKSELPAEEGGGEFKVTVRKLEMPVRPRGVLAE